MKITVNQPTEITFDAIRCVLAVRYDTEDMPADYPHRTADVWDVTINVETGQIQDWPANVAPRDLYMKVCDEGFYYLIGGTPARIVASRVDDYVPKCIPGDYGDYVDFEIDGNGRITNWAFDAGAAVDDFFPA